MTHVEATGRPKRGRPTQEERERRRDQVLDAAVSLFVAKGFGQTSIDELAAAARVTKRTIYTYFGDKAEVFTAAVERFRVSALAQLTAEDESLTDVATRLVLVLHSDEAVGLHRLMIAEAPQFPRLAERFYASGPLGYIELLSALLDAEGTPPDAAADGRAEALFGLLLGEPHRRRLLGLTAAPSPAEARRHARAALRLVVGEVTAPADRPTS
ncbi:TetR/AcrR family transcriptional regulator [Actinoalloteichus sp. AHMU CJ021]|uniref:Transcriptional regulator, TetR family n=1 Tax=Actinoalloteichus caeruleus DSM 43889 TaxID=1120930 RepID=A0ABT1JCT7_ACTCY|nr:TetR/AcrR family transcriptional regulator [Actinoalloteichus caeruleus]AUS80446.1 TetR/AcrR family transcriptional regulator [Actinoalloteichus sp. AHMU CJ021]MCP2330297.1 transcriptional regulator, TetR family [Actinoalloteichus caeruleus DSM 43889]